MQLSGLTTYQEYFQILLSLSGVLLGLAFTALIFVMQSGFTSFKFSRRMFLEFYVRFGRNLLLTLGYLVIISLGVLFLYQHQSLISVVYYAFMLMFVKTLLDYYKHVGYIHTLFSNKFVPAEYGPLRSYFRFLKNLGFIRLLPLLFVLAVFVIWPTYLSYKWEGFWAIGHKALFYSTLLLLVFSVLRIIQFIPSFFAITNQQLEFKQESEDNATADIGSPVDFQEEKRALLEFMESRGINETAVVSQPITFSGCHFQPRLLVDDGREAWFNVLVDTAQGDPKQIRDAVLRYGFRLLSVIDESMVDINSFVLSFHIQVEGDSMLERNVFFRTNRGELEGLLEGDPDPVSAMMNIENKLLNELFRDLQ